MFHTISKGDIHICLRNSLVILSDSKETRSSSSSFWITLARVNLVENGIYNENRVLHIFNLGFFALIFIWTVDCWRFV